MAGQLSSRSEFTETFAIHMALKSSLRDKQFDKNGAIRKTAQKLCSDLESERSIYGKQLKMINLMNKGATIGELGKKLHCSRRTVFRYLNNLEAAQMDITLDNGRYKVGKKMLGLLK